MIKEYLYLKGTYDTKEVMDMMFTSRDDDFLIVDQGGYIKTSTHFKDLYSKGLITFEEAYKINGFISFGDSNFVVDVDVLPGDFLKECILMKK